MTKLLKKEKALLLSIIRMLYINFKFIRIKSNGKIILKEHWWSFERYVTTIEEIAIVHIPEIMAIGSQTECENYKLIINSILKRTTRLELDLLLAVLEYLVKYASKYKFDGIIQPTKSFINVKFLYNKTTFLTKIKIIYSKLKIGLTSFSIEQYIKGLLFKPTIPIKQNIVTFEEKTTKAIKNLDFKVIGSVVNIRNEFAEKYSDIIRYISPNKNLYVC